MWPATYFKSRAAKLAAAYAIFLVVSFALLGALAVFLTDAVLRRQVDQKIATEMLRLHNIQSTDGMAVLLRILQAPESSETTLLYRYESNDHTVIAGNLSVAIQQPGWMNISSDPASTQEQPDRFRVFTSILATGQLTVASDVDEIENISDILTGVFSVAGIAAGAMSVLGGLWLSRYGLKNISQLAEIAEAIGAGALNQRMPTMASGDGFDRLSNTLNKMLDRNSELLSAQQRVTSNIAHDIRTPLTRLRQNLEQNGNAEAIEETDRILEITNSLLRIAELEEGARLAKFEKLDLSVLVSQTVEAYATSVEDSGRHLAVKAPAPVWVEGDKTLLLQLTSNLVENFLAHTPTGTHACLTAEQTLVEFGLSIADDGPGVAESERDKIFERFTRSDKSRSAQGNGLGLAVVSAIAKLHGAKTKATNLHPGLQISVLWPIKKPGSKCHPGPTTRVAGL